MSIQVSIKKQVMLGIILLIILLVVIEVVANVWWILQIQCEFEENEIFQNMEEMKRRQLCIDLYEIRTSGQEIIPNQSSDSITINKLGFRGPEFSEIKPENTYRIFMLGGSTMFGTGATSDQSTISGYVQQFFNEGDFEFNIEVVNAGIQGADSKTELKLIEDRIVDLEPDLIIMYDGWNDLRANHEPKVLKENWKSVCELGNDKGFDTIIILQPIAGFSSKILTKQESEYSLTGEDYIKRPLIESLSVYDDYALILSELPSCTKTADLRDIFDAEIQPIYWDQGHVADTGNLIIAKSFYRLLFPLIVKDEFSNTEDDLIFLESKIENNPILKQDSILKKIISNYKTLIMLSNLI